MSGKGYVGKQVLKNNRIVIEAIDDTDTVAVIFPSGEKLTVRYDHNRDGVALYCTVPVSIQPDVSNTLLIVERDKR